MSTYVDRTAGAVEYCEAAAAQHPERAEIYQTLRDHLQQKLWHQLTETLLQYFSNSNSSNSFTADDALALYDKVVTAVDNKLHPLSTARMAVLVAEQKLQDGDATAAKAVLENCLEKASSRKKDTSSSSSGAYDDDDQISSSTAKIYLQSKHSLLILQALLKQTPSFTLDTANDETKAMLQNIFKTMETNGQIVQELSSSSSTTTVDSDSSIVHAAHYETAMSYYKLLGPAEAFYEAALNYLGYTTTSATSVVEDSPHFRQLAVDLCLAALTGENVYNLTIVEQHPVLQLLLKPTTPGAGDYVWLVELFKAVAVGDVLAFRQLTVRYAAQIQTQPSLIHGAAVVQEKLTLTALVLFVLSRDAHERSIPFTELQQALHLLDDEMQIEYVLMRAFSTGLLQGSIDQVGQTADIRYVQPRHLSPSQMQELASKFADWAGRVKTSADSMQAQTANTLLA